MNVCIYARVSTAEQKEKGYSLGEQEARLKSYCEAKGWTCVKVYSDGGFSGANTNRPALKQMLKDISIYDAVLVWKLDRLSRSQKDTLILIDELQKHNCAFISLVEAFDTSTSIGRAMLGILSTFAQLEREQIAERMKMGKAGRAKTGKWHGGGMLPIGYDLKDGVLVPNDVADQVREVYRLFLEGVPISRIQSYMDDRYTGYNSRSTLKRILTNRTYTGVITHKGETYEGQHEAIIDTNTWQKVQAVLQSRKIGNKNASGRSLLTGFVKCECGSYMALARVGKYRYFYCGRKSSGTLTRMRAKCDNRRIPEHKLNEAVIQSVLSLDFKNIQPEKPKIDHTKEIKKIERQMSRLIELFQIESIDTDELKKRLTDLEKKKTVLTAPASPTIDIETCMDVQSKAEKVFASGDVAKSRAVLDALITKVIVRKASVEIHWSFST